MRNDPTTLLLAAGLGAISGIRGMSGIALLSRRQAADHGRNGRRAARTLTSLSRLLQRRTTSALQNSNRLIQPVLSAPYADSVIATMAVGEMTADKAADLPPRTDLPSIIARASLGAISGMAVAEMRSAPRTTAALVGAAAAIGSAHLFYRMRKTITDRTRIPDWAVGLIEDVLVLTGGARLVDRISSAR